VLLIEREVVRQWSDRKKTVREPLFPGYVFARVDERARLAVLQVEGVVRSVSFGARPAVVPDAEIIALQQLQSMPDRLEAVTLSAAPLGSEVMVTNGPLKGLRARVADHPKPLYLVLHVPSIGQAVRVQIPLDWVMRL
jgi:transcription antitermination factor NusG